MDPRLPEKAGLKFPSPADRIQQHTVTVREAEDLKGKKGEAEGGRRGARLKRKEKSCPGYWISLGCEIQAALQSLTDTCKTTLL